MTKREYLTQLEDLIRRLPGYERAEIMADYREHFEMGMADSKSEAEIAQALGSPRSVAKEILMNSAVKEATQSSTVGEKAQALMRIFMLILILAPFNFLILLGPFLVIFALVFTGWLTPLALASAFTVVVGALIKAGLSDIGTFSSLSLASMYIGVLGLTFLACLVMWQLTKVSVWLLIAYLKWNIEFITARKN